MRPVHLLSALAALTTAVVAKTSFAIWPTNGVTIGETYNVVWMSDAPERIIQLSLVRRGGPNDNWYWERVYDLTGGVGTRSPGGSLAWTVNDVAEPAEDGYALFIISEPATMRRWPWSHSRPGQTEDITNWFSICPARNDTNPFEDLLAQEI